MGIVRLANNREPAASGRGRLVAIQMTKDRGSRSHRIAVRSAIAGAVAFAAVGAALAGDPSNRPVRSLLEMRTAGVVMQTWDDSCGAAALTTVLKYRFGEPVTERVVALYMLKHGDPQKIEHEGGFSFLDLKHFATAMNYSAVGYEQVRIDDLKGWPYAIVPIIEYGRIPHFIVVRAVRADGSLDVADPGFGNRTLSARAFQSMWINRVALVVEPNGPR
jgi:predicted double-glycine peptidase